MLTADQMPDDNAKLAAIPVELPEVPLAGIAAPDSFISRILEYLAMRIMSPTASCCSCVLRMWPAGSTTSGVSNRRVMIVTQRFLSRTVRSASGAMTIRGG